MSTTPESIDPESVQRLGVEWVEQDGGAIVLSRAAEDVGASAMAFLHEHDPGPRQKRAVLYDQDAENDDDLEPITKIKPISELLVETAAAAAIGFAFAWSADFLIRIQRKPRQ